jgi:hypothetical protein
MVKKISTLFLLLVFIFTLFVPLAFADDDGCESWVLKGAGGVISGVDLSGKDFITSGISTVTSDTEILQGSTVSDYEKILKEHTTFIMTDHQEKTQKGYKDNIITVQAVGVATNGFDIWKSNNISTNEQGAYLNIPFKGSVFRTFHLPRSQYGQTETRTGSDGESYKVCEYYPINDARIEQVEKFIDKYTEATMKGIFLASLNRVANVYTFMSTEQIPLADLLQTSDNSNYTLVGGSQTSSLLYTFQTSVFPFAEDYVNDLKAFKTPGWEDKIIKNYMKKDYFETGLTSLNSEGVENYDEELTDKKEGFLGWFRSTKDNTKSIDDYLQSYNSIVSNYNLTVAPTDLYKGFIGGTSEYGKYVRFIDNTSVPAERRTGGITEFKYEVNGISYTAKPVDYLSMLLPVYVPGDFVINDDNETYSMRNVQPLDGYYISLLDLKLFKKNGTEMSLVGTITSYGDITLNDLFLYNNGEEGVVLLSKFKEGVFVDDVLEATGRSLKLRGDYSSNLYFQRGNFGKFDYLNVENQSDGVEAMFFAFSSGTQDYKKVHQILPRGVPSFRFLFEPCFDSSLNSGVVMVRNNQTNNTTSLKDFLNSEDKKELLKKIETKVPEHSADVDYDTHTNLVEMKQRLDLYKKNNIEAKVTAVFIFLGFLLIIYAIFLVLAYVFDMLGDLGVFEFLTFKTYKYSDGDDFIDSKGAKPLGKVKFIIGIFILLALGIFLVNARAFFGTSMAISEFFKGLFQ